MELQAILSEDPIGQILVRIQHAIEDFADSLTGLDHVRQALLSLDEESQQRIYSLSPANKADRAEAAAMLSVPEPDLSRYWQKIMDRSIGLHKAAMVQGNRSWSQLRRKANIALLGDELPPEPALIFVSTEQCIPCGIIKPCFARLAKHFDKAPVYYCADTVTAGRLEVDSFPALVALLPGSKLVMQCGSSARELWDAMNRPFSSDRTPSGGGELMCPDGECSIAR